MRMLHVCCERYNGCVCVFVSAALTSSSASPSAFTSLLGLDRAKQLFLIMTTMSARPPSDFETENKETI